MLTDEELKAIEDKLDRAHPTTCGCGECVGFDICYEGCVDPLLSEVKRLRAEPRNVVVMMPPIEESAFTEVIKMQAAEIARLRAPKGER
jgi:hypothetical protein